MATDHELITQAVQDCFGGSYKADAARMDQALHPDLVKRSPAKDDGVILTKELILPDGWKIADRLWLPQ